MLRTRLDSDPAFRDYYRSWFLNHHLTTPDGTLDLSEVVDYSYVADPRVKPAQQDILRLYDRALEISRGGARPSLTICCRTQFPQAGTVGAGRAFLCGATPTCVTAGGCRRPVDHRCAIGRGGAGGAAASASLSRSGARVLVPRRSARIATAGPICCSRPSSGRRTDYIWFIDDDDFVNAAAGPALARSLVAGAPLVVVASASKIQEKWQAPGTGGPIATGPRGNGGSVSGRPRLSGAARPQLGADLQYDPAGALDEATDRAGPALGDYNEDYFLLLLALTSARVEVSLLDCELSSVSIRGTENTVTQKDRSGWHLSLATFLLEIMNNGEGNSPFLWQLSNAPRW